MTTYYPASEIQKQGTKVPDYQWGTGRMPFVMGDDRLVAIMDTGVHVQAVSMESEQEFQSVFRAFQMGGMMALTLFRLKSSQLHAIAEAHPNPQPEPSTYFSRGF